MAFAYLGDYLKNKVVQEEHIELCDDDNTSKF